MRYTCSCGYHDDRTVTAKGHTFRNNTCIYCERSAAECIASEHPYVINSEHVVTIYQPLATHIMLTFSAQTETDDGFDFIEIYDGNDALIGRYTGTALSSQTVLVEGDTATIRLTSDTSMVNYGFAVTNVVAFVNGDADGDNLFDSADVRHTLRRLTQGNTSFTPSEQLAADYDNNGSVDSSDVRDMLRFLATAS